MKSITNRFWLRTIPGIAWFFVMVWLMCMPADELPDTMLFNNFDKLEHAASFGLMVFLFLWPFLYLDLQESTIRRLNRIILTGSSAFGFLIEVIQYYFIPGRNFEIFDWIADTIGALIGWWMIYQLQKRLRNQPKNSQT